MLKKLIAGAGAILLLGTGIFVYAAEEEEAIISPTGIYLLEDGGFLFTDSFQNAVWRYDGEGAYTKLAGNAEQVDANGKPLGGSLDGSALSATFDDPWGITNFLDGYAVTDTENSLVRFLDVENNEVATVGGENEGYANGVAEEASFNRPTGIVTLEDGSLLVADTGNHVIRKISTEGEVSLYAGIPKQAGTLEGSLTSAHFNEPTGLYYENGILYVVDSGNHRICKIEDEQMTSIAGAAEGYENGPAAQARFSWPTNIVAHEGVLYVADSGNGVIRAIENDEVSTLLETGAALDGFAPVDPRALAVLDGELWIGDVFAHDLFSVSLA